MRVDAERCLRAHSGKLRKRGHRNGDLVAHPTRGVAAGKYHSLIRVLFQQCSS